MRSYPNALRAAAEQRRRTPAPPILGKTLVLFAMVGLALVLSVLLRRSGRPFLYNFEDPRGMVTVVSALLLSMAAAFAFAAASFSRERGTRDGVAWLAFAAGLTFLAADDLLQFHLWLGHRLEGHVPLPPGVHGWDDLVVVAYGVVAGLVGLLALPSLISRPRVGRFLSMAVGFYLLHTLLDVLGPHRRLSVVFEESAKVFSGACLLLATYVGLLTIAGGAARPPTDS